jgi:gamma-glutamyltranspeptidase/glutathione hydrolase
MICITMACCTPSSVAARFTFVRGFLTAIAMLTGSLFGVAAPLNHKPPQQTPQKPSQTGSTSVGLPAELQTSEVTSAGGMVAAGSPEAARAGALMLQRGGNAVDAAVAAAFAMGVVNPLDAGLGGQAYVLIHLSGGRDVAIDGSAPLPLRFVPDELKILQESGFPYGYKFACTPSTPAALAYTLQRYGTMSLAQVLAPAIELADFGHVMMPHIELIVAKYAGIFREDETMANILLKDGRDPWPPGHVYCQPVLAATLRRLATQGVQDFYHGQIAHEIAADMAANGGYVSTLDLARVRVTERWPVRGTYRGLDVIAFPYPGGGDIVVEALEILGAFPQDFLRYDSVDRLHLLLEAVHIAFRDAFNGAETPFLSTVLLDPARAKERASLIRFDRALHEDELPPARGQWFQDRETTNVSVVDRFGNAVALTQSLGDGSGVAAPSLGFEYNSFLESFEFCDRQSPNFPKPFATVRSTMTPTILFCNGQPFLVLGAPGSARIPSTIISVVTNVVDRGMTLRDAVAAPRVLADRLNPKSPNGCKAAPSDPLSVPSIYVELAAPITVEQADELQARGFVDQYRQDFPVQGKTLRAFGGLTAVLVDPATGLLSGVGDPRRNCSAAAPSGP